MVADEKKRNTIYGSIFIYYVCFVLVAEVVLAKPYGENLLMETDVTVAEAVNDYVKDSVSGTYRRLSGGVSSAPKGNQDEKLSQWIKHWRDRPPTTYVVLFESFPTLVNLVKDGKYESLPFTAGGYNWTYIIYPNGDKRVGANGTVSLYVRIDNSTLITGPKDVYAEIKFFIYNRIEDKFYSHHESEAVKFNLSKPEFGIPSIQLTTNVLDPKNGYMFDGEQCVFGVDVFVAQPVEEIEYFSVDQYIPTPYPYRRLSGGVSSAPIGKQDEKLSQWIRQWRDRPPTTFSLKFKSFGRFASMVGDGRYESRPFTVGGYNWTFIIYPNGDQRVGVNGFISLYAKIDSSTLITHPEDVYAEIKFFIYNKIRDQYFSHHESEAVKFHLFKPEFGIPSIQLTATVLNPENGYMFDGGQCVFGVDVFVAQPFKEWEVSSKFNLKKRLHLSQNN